MSNIKIENLGFDANMDLEAMAAIAGGWGIGSIFSGVKRALRRINARSVYKYVRCYVRRTVRRFF
jgi:hypothetical protein